MTYDFCHLGKFQSLSIPLIRYLLRYLDVGGQKAMTWISAQHISHVTRPKANQYKVLQVDDILINYNNLP